MIGKINEFRDSLKTLKELENKLANFDMSDATQMMENLGIDMEQIENQFNNEYSMPKVTLNYVLDSDNPLPNTHIKQIQDLT